MVVEADWQFNYGHTLKSFLLMMFKVDLALIIVCSKIDFSDSFWRMWTQLLLSSTPRSTSMMASGEW
jgi:hypothetical protein